MGSLFLVVLVGVFEVAESLEICGFLRESVDLGEYGFLVEECLSAQEVGESGEFVRIGGDFD